MRLLDTENELAITIEGVHQYPPEIANAGFVPDPSPWLDIHVQARTVAGSWECHDDMLELRSVRFIAKWFRALAKGAPTHSAIYFEEPELAFEAIGRIASGLKVRVTLDGDCYPPGRHHLVGELPDFAYEISVDKPMLEAAASDLEDQLRNLGIV